MRVCFVPGVLWLGMRYKKISMKIEVAGPSDIPALCILLEPLFDQEAEFKPDHKAQVQGLLSIIKNEEIGDILVARRNGEVIGMVNLLYTVSTALGERVGLLEDMVVSHSSRGLGVGSRLLQYALDFAHEKGCKRITLLTDNDNEGANRFYKKHGFTRSSMAVFRKSLGLY